MPNKSTDHRVTLRPLAEKMDRLYKYERYIFDLTRPLYLVGRDQMLNSIKTSNRERVLEIGVGTARNLIKLCKQNPQTRYYGVDVSRMMLKTAAGKVKVQGLPIELALVDEHINHYGGLFKDETGMPIQTYDRIILSFCLTMIPDPIPVLEAAIRSLSAGGTLHIADYYDQADLPGPIARLLQKMMARYHVQYRKEVLEFLALKSSSGSIKPILFRVGYHAEYSFDNACL